MFNRITRTNHEPPILPTHNVHTAQDIATTSGTDTVPKNTTLMKRTNTTEHFVRRQFNNAKSCVVPNKPVKVGDYSAERVITQLGKTVGKCTLDGVAMYLTPAVIQKLAEAYLSTEVMNSVMGSGSLSGGGTPQTGGVAASGNSLLVKEGILVASIGVMAFPAFQTLQKGLRGAIFKTLAMTGFHSPVSAAVRNGKNLLNNELSNESIGKMSAEIKPKFDKIRAEITSNVDDIKYTTKFFDPGPLIRTTKQKYEVVKELTSDKPTLRAIPGWTDPVHQDFLIDGLFDRTQGIPLPMSRQQVIGDMFTHCCRSVKRVVPDEMQRLLDAKKIQPFNVDTWKVDKDYSFPAGTKLLTYVKSPKLPNHSMWVVGMAGTGKSKLSMLADFLDSPYFRAAVPGGLQGGFSKFNSAEWFLWVQTTFHTQDNLVWAKIPNELRKIGCSNAIIIWEEMDASDRHGALRNFDPWGTKKLHSDCTGFDYESDHFSIATSNDLPTVDKIQRTEEIVLDMIPAMASRVDIVLFGESSKEDVARDATAAFIRMGSLVTLIPEGAKKAELDEKQQGEMEGIFKATLPTIVDWHHKKFGALRCDTMLETMVGVMATHLKRNQLPTNKEHLEERTIPDENRQEALNDSFKKWVVDYYSRFRTYNPYELEREKQAEIDNKLTPEEVEEKTRSSIQFLRSLSPEVRAAIAEVIKSDHQANSQ